MSAAQRLVTVITEDHHSFPWDATRKPPASARYLFVHSEEQVAPAPPCIEGDPKWVRNDDRIFRRVR